MKTLPRVDTSPWNIVFSAAVLSAGCTQIPQDVVDVPPIDDGYDDWDEYDYEDWDDYDYDDDDWDDYDDYDYDDYWDDHGDYYDCYADADCEEGWECVFGYCEPPSEFECGSDLDCGDFEFCAEGEWTQTCEDWFTTNTDGDQPPVACTNGVDVAKIIILDEQPLALSFVDVDDDGREELVAVTNKNIAVIDGSGQPTLTARPQHNGELGAVEGGQLDEGAGEDLLLVVGTEHHRYLSNGDGTFAAPIVEPAPAGSGAAIVADFDGQGAHDVLSWGEGGATLMRGGEPLVLTQEPVLDASVLDSTTAAPGFWLHLDDKTEQFDITGKNIGTADALASSVALEHGDTPGFLNAYDIGNWSVLRLFDTSELQRYSGHPEHLRELAGADFDGNAINDLVSIDAEGGVSLTFSVQLPSLDCIRDLGADLEITAASLAVGDHDGDGNDELALQLADSTEIILIDVPAG